jgi:hypothetical protein
MNLEQRILSEDGLAFDIELVFLDLKMNLLIDEHAACRDMKRLQEIERELREIEIRIVRSVDFMNIRGS